MKAPVLALLLLAVVSAKETKEIHVKVNEQLMQDVIHDFSKFTDKYLDKTEVERKELCKELSCAWKDTAAKIILNFGKTIAPVASQWASIMKHV